MDIRNCRRCKKIYKYDGFKLCHSCRQEDEADFQTVKDFLNENPGANISAVVKGTDVETEKVIEFLREGRLEIRGGGDITLDCENCGVPINTGKYCNKCAKELHDQIGQAMGSGKEDETSKRKRTGAEFRLADRRER